MKKTNLEITRVLPLKEETIIQAKIGRKIFKECDNCMVEIYTEGYHKVKIEEGETIILCEDCYRYYTKGKEFLNLIEKANRND